MILYIIFKPKGEMHNNQQILAGFKTTAAVDNI